MPNVVIYARSSTDSQKRKQTTESQLAVCEKLATSRGAHVLGVFVDEGVSGTVPLVERPSARRMIALCRTGAVMAIVVARLDRLSRRLDQALADLECVAQRPVELWSASETEVSATRSSSEFADAMRFAELELKVVSERLSRGRDRAIEMGKWTGPIPFGYDMDSEGRLVPSTRVVAPGQTEAAVARSVFVALAQGSSTIAEARRLQSLGVRPGRRYSRMTVLSDSGRWQPSRVNAMIRNSLYAGTHEFASRFGVITRAVPPLVDQQTWVAAQERLTLNRGLRVAADRDYLLRGFVFCRLCGCRFAGTRASSGDWVDHYYRCVGALGIVRPEPTQRCRAKHLPATLLEGMIWRHIISLDPGLAEMSEFHSKRAVVERLLSRVDVYTNSTDRSARTATVFATFVDGSRLVEQIGRRPRRQATN